MTFTSTTTAAAEDGGSTTITAVHPDVIQSHILNRLDGPTLASTTCASAQFLSLCSDDHLWKDICNSTWPSTTNPRVTAAISAFSSGHRSFYSDAFPSLRHLHESSNITHHRRAPDTSELISAVDIHFDGELIYSKVLVTETLSTWFLNTPFRLELLDPKETVATPLKLVNCDVEALTRAGERLSVSWILIDPFKKRAVNVASRTAVEARRHWLTEDVQLRYAVVLAADGGGEMVQCAVVVTCGVKEGGGEWRVREVIMQVEEMEGRIVAGMDSLVILEAAMEGRRWRSDGERERGDYEMFLRMKARRRERKQRREKGVDLVCVAAGLSIFFAVVFGIFFLSR